MVKRGSIHSIVAVWASNNDKVIIRAWCQAPLAVFLFLSAIDSRGSGPNVDMLEPVVVIVALAFFAVILILYRKYFSG